MATQQQCVEPHKTTWKIANDLRGSLDGWEFKTYAFGSIFYRFISEYVCDYFNKRMHEYRQKDFNYADIPANS